VQRLFSAFPGGWPGVGLLLLRAAVGIAAASQGVHYIVDGEPAFATWAAGAAAIACGALLVVGFLTSGAGAIVVLGCMLMALASPPPFNTQTAPDRLAIAFLAVVAAAIVPLGPGAFSFDARLFGRREIVIHQDARVPKQSRSRS
jgi:uncharacterized membrane protein YphA (DoxX/SURF4 family)